MAILYNSSKDPQRLVLEGAVDIGTAADLKAALVDALRSVQDVNVSLEAVTELDVTAFQLLLAAQRAAQSSGVILTLTGPLQDSVRQTLAGLGVDEILLTERGSNPA